MPPEYSVLRPLRDSFLLGQVLEVFLVLLLVLVLVFLVLFLVVVLVFLVVVVWFGLGVALWRGLKRTRANGDGRGKLSRADRIRVTVAAVKRQRGAD